MATTVKYDGNWSQSLMDYLKENNITHDLVTYRADSKLLKMREYDWEKSVVSGMWLNVKTKPNRYELRLTGVDVNGVDAPIGSVEFYDDSKNWKYAITLPLFTKTLEYRSGDSKECLLYDQQAILLEDDLFLDLKEIGVRSIPPVNVPQYVETCGVAIVAILIIIILTFLIGC